MNDVDMFMGFGGDFVSNLDESSATGILVSGVDIGVSLSQLTSTSILQSSASATNKAYAVALLAGMQTGTFFSLNANIDSAELIGVDGLDFQVRGLNVDINSSTGYNGGYGTPVIDYSSTYGELGYEISAGESSIYLAESEEVYSVDIDQAMVQISDFVYVQGSLALEFGGEIEATINTGLGQIGDAIGVIPSIKDLIDGVVDSDIAQELGLDIDISDDYSTISGLQMSTITIAGSDLEAFVGFGGPYKKDYNWDEDTNNDGNYYNDFYYNSSATGFVIEDLDFGLVIMECDIPAIGEQLGSFYALHISADRAGLVGMNEDINGNGVIDQYSAEDLNNNGILDNGEDTNNDGVLNYVSEDSNSDGILNSTLKFEARDIEININDGPKWAGLLGPATVDLTKFSEDYDGDGKLDSDEDINNNGVIDDAPFRIYAGHDQYIYLDMNSAITEIKIGLGEINIMDFAYLRGSFYFSKQSNLDVVINEGDLGSLLDFITTQDETLPDTQARMNVDALVMSATNLYGFVGTGGTPWQDLNNDGEIVGDEEKWANPNDSTGVMIMDVDATLAIMTPSLAQLAGSLDKFVPKFLTVKLSVDTAGLIGLDDYITMTLKDIEVDVNTLYIPASALPGPAYSVYLTALAIGAMPNIDYVSSFKGEDLNDNGVLDNGEDINGNGVLNRGLQLSSGTQAVFLDYDKEILRLSAYADIRVLGALQLSAGIVIGKTIQQVTLHDSVSNTDGVATTIGLSIAIIDAFGYIGEPVENGSYWVDANNDGYISDDDGYAKTDEDVIGVALQDLDFGLVVMRQTGDAIWSDVDSATQSSLNTQGKLSLFIGAKASISSVELVGVDSFELKSTDFFLNLNFSTSLTMFVDFSRSKIDEEGNKSAYEIAVNEALTLSFADLDSAMLQVQGNAIARLYNGDSDYIRMSGAFAIDISSAGMTVFADGQISIADGFLEGNAQLFLSIDSRGLAGTVGLNLTVNLPDKLSLDASLTLNINTTGQDITYTVPQKLQDIVGYTSVTVSATPPEMGNPVDFYVSLSGNGTMNILNTLDIEGDFSIVFYVDVDENDVTTMKAIINASAVLKVDGLSNLGVAGTLGLVLGEEEIGFYGSLEVGGDPAKGGAELLSIGSISIKGGFLLQINATNATQTVKRLTTDYNGNVTGTEYEELEAFSLRIAGAASITLVESIAMRGSFDLKITTSSLNAKIDMRLDLGSLGYVAVGGEIAIIYSSQETAFAMNAYFDVDLSVGIASIDASANLQINTSSTTEYAGVQAGTYFKLDLDGELKFLFFTATFQGGIDANSEYTEVRIDKAELDFFNALTITISGYFRTDGNWYLGGNVALNLTLGPLQINGLISVELGNEIFAFEIAGELKLYVDVWYLPTIDYTLASFSAGISVTAKMATLHASVTVFGLGFSGSKTWINDDADTQDDDIPAPVIATQEGGKLYLNSGDRATYREVDGNTNYIDVVDESYYVTTASMYYAKKGLDEDEYNDIKAEFEDAGRDFDTVVAVEFLDHVEFYDNVEEIVMDGGDGNDYLMVDNNITQKITFYGGEGDDKLVMLGGTSDSIIYGDSGNDEFEGNVAGLTYYGGIGNDKFKAVEVYKADDDPVGTVYDGSAIIDLGEGYNFITGSEYNDTIYSYGSDSINAMGGDDIIYVYGTNTSLDGGDGDDTAVLDLDNKITLDLGTGNNTLQLNPFYSEDNIILGDNKLSYKDTVIDFGTTIKSIVLEDLSENTTVVTDYTNDIGWESTDLTIIASGYLDVSGANFKLANNHLALLAVNGITDTINTEVKSISIINYSNNEEVASIKIVEKDGLEIVAFSAIQDKALYSQYGEISIATLDYTQLIAFKSGVIQTVEPMKDISFKGDNFEFSADSENIKGLGNFVIENTIMKQSYRIGSLGLTSLTGKELNIEFIDLEQVNVGDRFEIFLFDNSEGVFSTGSGFFGFKSDYYLDVDTSNGKLELVVKEFLPGDEFDFVSDKALDKLDFNQKQFDTIGMWLNFDYFDGIPLEITVDITINVQDVFFISGTFTLRYQTNYLLTLVDSVNEDANWEDVLAKNYSISAINTTAFLGKGYDSDEAFGFSFTNVNIVIALFDAINEDDNRSWLIANASIGGAEFVGIEDLIFKGGNLELALSQGFGTNSDGSDNTSVVNLSINPLELGLDADTMVTLDDDGSLGERLNAGGTVDIEFAGFALSGAMAFSTDDSGFKAIGNDITAKVETEGFGIGLENASFGLIVDGLGAVLEANGGFFFYGDGFSEASADSITLRYNDRGINPYSEDLKIGTYTFAFSDFGSDNDVSAISVTNLQVTLFNNLQLSGSFAVEKNGDEVKVISLNATTIFSVADMSVGLKDTSFGMLIRADGKKVIQTEGSAFANLGDDIALSAEKLVVEYNETDEEYTGIAISAGAVTYTYSELEANLTTPKVTVENAYIKIFDVFELSGDFAFYKTENQEVSLSDGNSASVDFMSIGANDVTLFSGANKGTENEAGLLLGGLNVAMAFMSDRNSARSWVSLKASANEARLSGIDGISFEAKDIDVVLNMASDDGVVVDYSTPLEIETGMSTTMALDMNGDDGEIIKISGNTKVNLFDKIIVEGSFAFDSQASKDVYIAKDTVQETDSINVSYLALSFADASAFFGDNKGTDDIGDDFGLALDGIDLAIAVLNENDGNRSWATIMGNIEELDLRGVELPTGISMDISDTFINMNMQASDGSVIDYVQSAGEAHYTDLSLSVGSVQNNNLSTVTFDIDGKFGELIQVGGYASLNLYNKVVADGGFAFESKTATVITNESTREEIITNNVNFTFFGVSAFIGFDQGTEDTSDDRGVRITDMDLVLGVFKEKDGSRTWVSVDSNVTSIEVLGLEAVDISVKDAIFIANTSASDGSVIDFVYMKKVGLEHTVVVSTSDGEASVSFGADGAKGEYIELVTDVDLSVENYFYTSGTIGIQASTQMLYTNDSDTPKEYQVLAFTAKGLDVFAGQKDENGDGVGVTISDVSFALALAFDNDANTHIALSATAGSVALEGLGDEVDFNIQDISVDINVGFNPNDLDTENPNPNPYKSVIDFKRSKEELNSIVGSEDTMIIDINGNDGTLFRTQMKTLVTIGDFFAVEGYFALEISEKDFILSNGSTVSNASMVSFGAGDLTGYIGTHIGTEDFVGLELEDVNFTVAVITKETDVWTSAQASVGLANFAGLGDDFIIKGENLNVALNLPSITSMNTIDYVETKKQLDVSVGTEETYVLDMSGALLQASGTMTIKINSFFYTTGTIVFEKSEQEVLLNTGETVTVDTITTGAIDFSGFVGFGYETENETGFKVDDLDFALMILSDQDSQRTWTSVKANVNSIGFVGNDDYQISGGGEVYVNMKASDGTLVNYEDKNITIQPKGSSNGITFDIVKTDTNVFVLDGDFHFKLYNFITFDKHISFSQSFETVTLTDGSTRPVAYLSFSVADVDIFAGFNQGTDEEIGLKITDAGFGFAIFVDLTNPSEVWFSAKAEIQSVEFVGFDGITLAVSDFALVLNTASISGKSIDFATQNVILAQGIGANIAGVELGGGEGITLDAPNEMFGFRGTAEIRLFDIIGMKGSIALETAKKEIKLSDGTTTIVNLIAISAYDISAFAGFNMDDTENRIGFSIEDLDFALVIANDTIDTKRNWLSLEASVGLAEFKGIADITIAGKDLFLDINKSASDNTVIDYTAMGGMSIAGGYTVTLDTSRGSHIALGGEFIFNAFNILQFDTSMAFMFNFTTVKLVDGTYDDVVYLSVALTDIRVFAGLNDGTDSAVGFEINDIDIGFAVSYSIFTGRSWLGIQGKASDMSLLGLDFLVDFSADKAQIAINMPILHEKAIDYSATPLTLQSLNGGTPMIMDMSGDAGPAITISIENASFTIFDFIHIRGSVAFSLGGPIDMVVESSSLLNSLTGGLIDGATKKSFYYMSLAVGNADMFVGFNTPYYGYGELTDGFGYYARGVDLGVGIFVEDIIGSYLNMLTPEQLLKLDLNTIKDIDLSSLASLLDIDVAQLVSNLPIPMIDAVVAAHVDEIGATGFGDYLKMNIFDANLKFNFGITYDPKKPIPDMPWINFKESFPEEEGRPAGFAMATGGEPLYIDFDRSMLEITGSAEMRIDQFIYLRGSVGVSLETALKARVSMGTIQSFIESLANNAAFSINDLLGDDFDLETALNIDLSTIQLDMYAITITASDLYGFVGIGGPYYYDSNDDGYIDLYDTVNTNAVGLAVSKVDLGMVLAMPTAVTELGLGGRIWPIFVTGKMNIGEGAFLAGAISDYLSIKVQDISIDLNNFFLFVVIEEPQTLAIVNAVANAVFQVVGAPFIDWKASFSDFTEDANGNGVLDPSEDVNNNGILDDGEDLDGDGILDLREDWNSNGYIDEGGYYLKTGSASGIFLDYANEVIGAGIGYAEINIGGMLTATGGISITKESSKEVILSNGDRTYVTSLSMTMNNINGFIGYGNYFQDTNLNGRFDADDDRNEDAVGLVLDDMNLALTLMLETKIGIDGVAIGAYMGAYANIGKVGVTGISGIELNASDLEFVYSGGVRAYAGLGIIDFDSDGSALISEATLTHLPLTLTAVDFSRSTYIDEYGNTQSGYAIGKIEPVVLTSTNLMFAIRGGFELKAFDLLQLSGYSEFEFDADKGISIFTTATAKSMLGDIKLFEVSTLGEFVINSQGFYGSLQLGDPFAGDITLIDNPSYTLSGAFLVQINATGSTQQFRSLELDENGSLTGKYVYKDVEKTSIYIAGKIGFEFLDVISIDGSASLKLSSEGLIGSASFNMDLLSFGKVNLLGNIAILNTANEGLVFAMNMDTHVNFGLGLISINADAVVNINTSRTTSYFGVDTNTYMDMYLNGHANLLTFNVDFEGKVLFTDDTFELAINKATINFFNIMTINASGYIHGDGEFYFTGTGGIHIGLDIPWIKSPSIDINLDFVLSNDVITAGVDAKITYWYPKWQQVGTGWFGIPLYGFVDTQGSISLSAGLDISYYSAKITTEILGKEYSLEWAFGDAPQIATKVDDTLYLNIGDRADQRGSGGAFDSFENEDYEIWEENGVVFVKAFGQVSTYRGITTIVGNAGSGNDKIKVAQTVTKKLLLTGGDGDDIFDISGGSSDSIIYGGEGNDVFINTVANIKYFGEGGDDTFTGSDVNEYIDMGVGANSVFAFGGNDLIFDSGMSTIDAGSGDDIVTIKSIKALDITFGDGNDTLVFQDSASEQNYTIGDSSIKYGLVTLSLAQYGDIENIIIDSTTNKLIVSTTENHNFDGINLGFKSSSTIDVTDANFDIKETLSIEANGIIGTITGNIANLNVINKSTTTNKDVYITVDNLVVDGQNIKSSGSIIVEAKSLTLNNSKLYALENVNIKTDELSSTNSIIDGWKDLAISSMSIADISIGSNSIANSFVIDLSKFGTTFSSYTIGDETKNLTISDFSITKNINFKGENITIASENTLNMQDGSFSATSIDILGDIFVDDIAISAEVLNISANLKSNVKGSRVEVVADKFNIKDSASVVLSDSAELIVLTSDMSLDGVIDVDGKTSIISIGDMIINGNIYTNKLYIASSNDLNINTILGVDDTNNVDTNTTDITLISTSDINISENGGIKTGANLVLSGTNINIDGDVFSQRLTESLSDEEVTFIVSDSLNINGEFGLAGSLKIMSTSDLVIGGSGIDMSSSTNQHLKLYANGAITIEADTAISVDKYLELSARGDITLDTNATLSSKNVIIASSANVSIDANITAQESIRVSGEEVVINTATLSSDSLVHIKATSMSINDGASITTNANDSRVLLNAGDLVFGGLINSHNSIDINVGVDASKDFYELEDRVSLKRLSTDGDFTINDSAVINSINALNIKVGGEIIGAQKEFVSSTVRTMDISLTFIGYYKMDTQGTGNSIQTQSIIEGVDFNTNDIDWGEETPAGSGVNISTLTKAQQDIVLNAIGYKELYTLVYSNYTTTNIVGENTTNDTTTPPSWKDSSNVVYSFEEVEGLESIYIQVPQGAYIDIVNANVTYNDSTHTYSGTSSSNLVEVYEYDMSAYTSVGSIDIQTNDGGSGVTLDLSNQEDFDITHVKLTDGATLVLTGADPTKPISIGGNTEGAMSLSPEELALLANLGALVIGSADTSAPISIGDGSSEIIFATSLVIQNSADGGEVSLSSKLSLIGGASLSIEGSGHTTTVSNDASVTEDGDIDINDSIKVDGSMMGDFTIELSAEYGNIILGGANAGHSLNGDSEAGDDKLSLSTDGDVIINANVGDTDALEALTIEAKNITFNQSVVMNGTLSITASGTVVFNDTLTITGDLIIYGAKSVSFLGGVSVSGNIILQSDEIDLSASMSGDTLAITTTTSGKEIYLGDGGSDEMLNLTATELSYIQSGFSAISIGQSGTSHATSTLSNVTFGGSSSGLFNQEVSVYANEIKFDTNASSSLVLSSNLILDAYGDISINNGVTSSANVSIYSVSGSVTQNTTTYFDVADLSINTKTGIEVQYIKADNIDVTNQTSGNIKLGFGDVVSIDNITQSGIGTISITSNSDINIDTNMTSQVQTEISTANGDIIMNDDHSISIGSANITLDASGDIKLGVVNTNGLIELIAGGSLVDNLSTESANIISSQKVKFSISDSIGSSSDNINTNISTFETKSLNSIYLENTKSISLDSISVNNSISIKANGNITQNDNTTLESNTGDIKLEATGALSIKKLIASTDITLSGASLMIDSINASNALSHIEADTLDISLTNSIGSSSAYLKADVNSVNITSTSGDIYFQNISDLAVDEMSATSGNIDLLVDGNITDNNSDSVNFSTTTLKINATSFGSSDDVIETNITNLSLDGDLNNICIAQNGDLNLITSESAIEIDGDISICRGVDEIGLCFFGARGVFVGVGEGLRLVLCVGFFHYFHYMHYLHGILHGVGV